MADKRDLPEGVTAETAAEARAEARTEARGESQTQTPDADPITTVCRPIFFWVDGPMDGIAFKSPVFPPHSQREKTDRPRRFHNLAPPRKVQLILMTIQPSIRRVFIQKPHRLLQRSQSIVKRMVEGTTTLVSLASLFDYLIIIIISITIWLPYIPMLFFIIGGLT